jgi:hypothetical protein
MLHSASVITELEIFITNLNFAVSLKVCNFFCEAFGLNVRTITNYKLCEK